MGKNNIQQQEKKKNIQAFLVLGQKSGAQKLSLNGGSKFSVYLVIKLSVDLFCVYVDDILEAIVAGYLDPNTICNAISACP